MKRGIDIASKIIFFGVFLTMAAAGFMGNYFLTSQDHQLNRDMDRLGYALANHLATNSEWATLTVDKTSLQQQLTNLLRSEQNIIYGQIKSIDSGVLAKSGFRDVDTAKYYVSPIVTDVAEASDTFELGTIGGADKRIIGKVTLGLSTAALQRELSRLKAVNTLVVLIAIIILILGIFFGAHYLITRQLMPLMEGIEKVGNGELYHRVPVRTSDELGKLASSFNVMVTELTATHISRDYLYDILNSMLNCLLVVDERRMITVVNKATTDMLGYSEEEILGQDVKMVFAPGEFDEQGFTKINNDEKMLQTKDGRKIPVLFSVSVMREKNGAISGIVCVAQNITGHIH